MSRGPKPKYSQQPPGVVQNWSALQCSKKHTKQCGYDHAPVTRGRMRAQFPLPHGPPSCTQSTFKSHQSGTKLVCAAVRQGETLNWVVMTMRLWHGGVCEPSIGCLMAQVVPGPFAAEPAPRNPVGPIVEGDDAISSDASSSDVSSLTSVVVDSDSSDGVHSVTVID